MKIINAIYKRTGKKYQVEVGERISPFTNKMQKFYKLCGSEISESEFDRKFKISKEEVESDDMIGIADLLRSHTADFKSNLIETTKSWAGSQVDKNIVMRDNYFALPKTPDWKGSYIKTYQHFLGEIEGRNQANKMQRFVSDLLNFDRTIFVQREIRIINAAFETDIKKLAKRMSEKNMNLNSMKIKNLCLKAGTLDLWITDGNITFHARTILANGRKLQPHYRFITKNLKSANIPMTSED